MSPVRLSLGVIAFFGLALPAACGSSSSGATASDGGGDGASDDGTLVSPESDSGAANPLGMLASLLGNVNCGPLSGLTGLLGGGGGGGSGSSKCESGKTCCTMVAIPSISASCVAVGSCSGTSNECSAGADCSSGQVCCSGSSDGGSMAASAPAADGGLGGIGAMLGNFLPSTSCQSSCTATQTQPCASDTECPAGQMCNAAGGLGGIGGALGGLGGMLPKTCGTPPPEAGTTPATMDSGMTTTMTPEASVDAPSE